MKIRDFPLWPRTKTHQMHHKFVPIERFWAILGLWRKLECSKPCCNFAQNHDFFKNHFLLNSIYFSLQTTYKYVPYINQMRIISRSRRYLQIWPTTFTFRATAVQTGLINFVTVLSSMPIVQRTSLVHPNEQRRH